MGAVLRGMEAKGIFVCQARAHGSLSREWVHARVVTAVKGPTVLLTLVRGSLCSKGREAVLRGMEAKATIASRASSLLADQLVPFGTNRIAYTKSYTPLPPSL